MDRIHPIFVTIARAVETTGISRTALYEALKRGDLAARRPDGGR